jgi:hypothetical protein
MTRLCEYAVTDVTHPTNASVTYKTMAQTLLVLSILNLVFAAPDA